MYAIGDEKRLMQTILNVVKKLSLTSHLAQNPNCFLFVIFFHTIMLTRACLPNEVLFSFTHELVAFEKTLRRAC
ncbi:hypothetical protein Fmac_017680 [Flemingia macrophylla]|uniref:Uncharacterized protein n=1 Tax=Flemingia macrophylla TaxID=520843 RepID=A0ABD1M2U0_9FABA